MNTRQPGIGPGIDKSKSIEDLHHLRLMTLLDELVRDKGIMRAARELEVNYRTLTAGLESGRLSRRLRGALEKALLEGGGSPAQEQRERNDALEGRLEIVEAQVKAVGEDAGKGLTAVQGQVKKLRNDYACDLQRVESRLAKVEGGGGQDVEEESGDGAAGPPAQVNMGRRSPTRLRRDFPDLVTIDPAEDDEAVFGGAWALIREWRTLKETHPNRGRGLDWLRRQERLLTVELALLEEHGLTLPPETYPLRGLDRGAQVNWRRKALVDTEQARKKRELLLWLRRVLTFNLWRK